MKINASMKSKFMIGLAVAVLGLGYGARKPHAENPAAIPIIVSDKAAKVEWIAAQELARYLRQLYPNERFEVGPAAVPESGKCIVIVSPLDRKMGAVFADASSTPPHSPESFAVRLIDRGRLQIAVIEGADPRGVIYAVYTLLERLGCGFYLSYDAIPPARKEPLSFDGWRLRDTPLVRDRIVFNWHNFLSGCSTWNLPDWQHWINQSQKMGYNGVMVHAYGNNPMVSFSFNGKEKPVGYLSTTQKGRDWSTQHVNDVRRLWGGFVFSEPVFGCAAAKVPDAERARAARRLMHDVFAHAEERDVDVYLAIDVDTASANPQTLIRTLPESARFPIAVGSMRWMNQDGGGMWLANPDTPEGYRYFKALVDAQLDAYPQVDCLVVWFRIQNTPWMGLKREEMPPAWQKEYDAELEKTPEAAKLWKSHNLFAIGKIANAFEKAVKEAGRDDVEIAVGSWMFHFLPAGDRFLPRHIKFIPLDWDVLHDRSQLRDAASRRVIREAGAHRPVVPVVWAHHDDGNYVGRPYTPFSDFHARLVDCNAAGFGIIHWTTRPLDPYFKSLAKQVWLTTKDQPLQAACDEMAVRLFGPAASETMSKYLQAWLTEGAKIGRETSDWFIDRKLPDMAGVTAGYEERMKRLNDLDEAALDPAARDRLEYYKGLEQFVVDVYRTEDAFQKSRALYEAGDVAAARGVMAACRPEAVIERYARFSSLGRITRGEQGLVASMNLRWLTHYVRHRQALGMEPVRYNFAPTSHDPLAQSMGTFTFHFDRGRNVWECLGTKETGAATFLVPDNVEISRPEEVPVSCEEICRTGIESDAPITIAVQPIMAKGGRGRTGAAPLPAGSYRLHLLFLDPTSDGPGERVFDVTLKTPSDFDSYGFEPVRAAFLRVVCHGNSENDWNSINELRVDTLDKRPGEAAVTASEALEKYPAKHAVDGNQDTRWAVEGVDQWIQCRLDPDAATDRIDIAWYRGATRQARFEILVSNDGRQWSKVKYERRTAASSKPDRVDVFASAGRAHRIVQRSYPFVLDGPGRIDLTLTPIRGKSILCGAILTPRHE